MLQRAKECELEQLIHDVFCYDVTGKILGVEDGKPVSYTHLTLPTKLEV